MKERVVNVLARREWITKTSSFTLYVRKAKLQAQIPDVVTFFRIRRSYTSYGMVKHQISFRAL